MAGFADQPDRDRPADRPPGKPIRTVVNSRASAVPTSDRRMAYHALRRYADPRLQARLLSNVDGAAFVDATRDLDPAETPVSSVVSKSWHTSETLAFNATTARAWVLDAVRRGHRHHDLLVGRPVRDQAAAPASPYR